MRIAFAADDENDTTRAVLDLIGRRGDEVVLIPGSAGAPAEAGALSAVSGSASSGVRSAGSEASGATREGGATGAQGPAPAEAGAMSRAWPDLGAAVGRAVVGGAADFGIVMCWTGTGTAIAANKVPGVRAALAWEPWIARGARLWNDANVLAMSLKRLAPDVAAEVAEAFLAVEEPDPDEVANIETLDRLLPP